MATTVRDPLVGRVIDGRYRIVDRIATGGMATVYRALDLRLERPVAVKILHAGWASDAHARMRFQREARAAAQLSHPDVVSVFDAGEDGGEPFLVMEYVAGATLRDVIRDRLRLGAGEAAAVMDHVLAALAAAHRIGLVHRDVKPENVLITPDGRVKVADFGLARAVADATITTTASGLIGTAAYLAPEQWTGQAVDAGCDVYAAGVMLFELLTGTPPFAGDSPAAVMRRHLEEAVPPPSTFAPGVPAELDRLVGWATEREASDRPRDAAELHAALLAAARHEGLVLQVPALPVATTTRLQSAEAAPTGATAVVPPTSALPVAPAVPPAAVVAGGPPDATTFETEAAGRRRRHWPWILLLVLLLAAGAGVLGWWLAVGRYVAVPDLRGDTKAAAETQLHKLGLHPHYLAPVYSGSYAKGDVAAESPAPGHGVVRGGAVEIRLSKGPRSFPMPSVRGEPRSSAITTLKGYGLKVGKVETAYSSSIAKHDAVGTVPPANQTVESGQSVTLIVSKGHAPVSVPAVTGLSPDAATQKLQAAGLSVSATRQVYDDSVPAGQVARTNPAAGVPAPYHSAVVLVVSKGPKLYPVPDVSNQPIGKAIRTLRAAGFKPEAHSVFPGGPGIVLKEDPSGGSSEPHGTTVVLDYY